MTVLSIILTHSNWVQCEHNVLLLFTTPGGNYIVPWLGRGPLRMLVGGVTALLPRLATLPFTGLVLKGICLVMA